MFEVHNLILDGINTFYNSLFFYFNFHPFFLSAGLDFELEEILKLPFPFYYFNALVNSLSCLSSIIFIYLLQVYDWVQYLFITFLFSILHIWQLVCILVIKIINYTIIFQPQSSFHLFTIFLVSTQPKLNNLSRPYSSHNTPIAPFEPNSEMIDPWFITGLSDGDGSFYISISRTQAYSLGWHVQIGFKLIASATPDNLIMLEIINKYFKNIGAITIDKSSNVYQLFFRGLTSCLIIKSHFDLFPLMTYKLVYYQLWSQVLALIELGEHKTMLGLFKIVGLKSLFKMGLSPMLKAEFAQILI